MLSSLSLGTDPEFFFVKDGAVVPADTLLPDKTSPILYDANGYRQNLYADGVQAESTINASGCRAYLLDYLWRMLKVAGTYGEVSVQSALPVEDVSALSDYARQFGCEGDKNGWLDGGSLPNTADPNAPMRFAGGHIHVGEYTYAGFKPTLTPASNPEVAKVLDYTAGVASVLIENDPSASVRRRAYGLAGSYRDTVYRGGQGIEYRVPGSGWLRSPAAAHAMFGIVRNAVDTWRRVPGLLGRMQAIVAPEELIVAINDADKDKAKEILSKIFPHVGNFNSGLFKRTPELALYRSILKLGDTPFDATPQGWRLEGRVPVHASGLAMTDSFAKGYRVVRPYKLLTFTPYRDANGRFASRPVAVPA